MKKHPFSFRKSIIKEVKEWERLEAAAKRKQPPTETSFDLECRRKAIELLEICNEIQKGQFIASQAQKNPQTVAAQNNEPGPRRRKKSRTPKWSGKPKESPRDESKPIDSADNGWPD
jgi:hypothetical protein